jgi:3-oxoacyl-[acyl-carrier-protein] synthase III
MRNSRAEWTTEAVEDPNGRMEIPREKFVVAMCHCGNTVSSTIPIALKESARDATI